MKCSVRVARGLLLCLSLLFADGAFGHNPDTSYARVAIADEQIDIRLTFDLFTLEKIAPLDVDRDQQVTRAEIDAAAPGLALFLRGNVRLELDGKLDDLGEVALPSLAPGAGDSIPSADWHTANGLVTFAFRHRLNKPVRDVTLIFDFFEILGSRHTVLGSFEYRGKTEEVTFTQPEPDFLFDTSYAGGDPGGAAVLATKHEASFVTTLSRFLKLGIEHIFTGYDHICFLLALIVVSRFREMVKIITSFTVAHCITLILAALGIVRLPSRLVECSIALTIVYVAVENLRQRGTGHRWMLSFGFGLVHGFGFASVLSELGLPTVGRIRCLLAFNVGVELGQLVILALALPVIWMLAKRHWQRGSTIAVSSVVGAFGVAWFIERAFGLSFMPL